MQEIGGGALLPPGQKLKLGPARPPGPGTILGSHLPTPARDPPLHSQASAHGRARDARAPARPSSPARPGPGSGRSCYPSIEATISSRDPPGALSPSLGPPWLAGAVRRRCWADAESRARGAGLAPGAAEPSPAAAVRQGGADRGRPPRGTGAVPRGADGEGAHRALRLAPEEPQAAQRSRARERPEGAGCAQRRSAGPTARVSAPPEQVAAGRESERAFYEPVGGCSSSAADQGARDRDAAAPLPSPSSLVPPPRRSLLPGLAHVQAGDAEPLFRALGVPAELQAPSREASPKGRPAPRETRAS